MKKQKVWIVVGKSGMVSYYFFKTRKGARYEAKWKTAFTLSQKPYRVYPAVVTWGG